MTGIACLLGAAVLATILRGWRREFSWRLGLGYTLLVGFTFFPVLGLGRTMGPADIAYSWRPWRALETPPPRPQNPLLADVLLQMLPFRELVRERLLRGELPLWAPELGTGAALLSNGQSAPFAPLGLLALPLPGLAALSVIECWKLLVALWLTHLLLRRLRARVPAAAFGAIGFAFSSFTIAWLGHPHSAVSIWAPGIVLGLIEVAGADPGARRAGFWGLVGCGLCLAGLGLAVWSSLRAQGLDRTPA